VFTDRSGIDKSTHLSAGQRHVFKLENNRYGHTIGVRNLLANRCGDRSAAPFYAEALLLSFQSRANANGTARRGII